VVLAREQRRPRGVNRQTLAVGTSEAAGLRGDGGVEDRGEVGGGGVECGGRGGRGRVESVGRNVGTGDPGERALRAASPGRVGAGRTVLESARARASEGRSDSIFRVGILGLSVGEKAFREIN
jgi:hypothetical protein